MRILEVIPLDKKKSRVVLEGAEGFALYQSEIRRFGIVSGEDLEELTLETIYREILYKRGKERALYILKNSDKSEHEMRVRLQRGYYPEEIINQVIAFLKNYGYVDDCRYAENYIHFYHNSKSRRIITQNLMQKGISKEVISEVFLNMEEELSENSEREQIYKLLQKKHYNDEKADYKERNRMMGFLVRRGFQLEDIQHCMKYDAESQV